MARAESGRGVTGGRDGRDVRSRARNVWRRVLQSWGTAEAKRATWNSEFADGRWDYIAETPGDCVYRFVEKHAAGGDILDLGSGSGNTGNEIDYSAYRSYVGVDVSDVAIQKAIERTSLNGRTSKNRYVRADVVTYRPQGTYRVVLFRESLYYVPRRAIVGVLKRYRSCLAGDGVIVVRLCDRRQYADICELIRSGFDVLEEFQPEDSSTVVLVFR
jgi:SAM-dependent methyltransferase